MDASVKITNFLLDLGLDEEESKIYLVLANKGIMTALEISRQTGIDRSKVYRRLEDLKFLGIVEEVIDQKKRKAKAVEVDKLEFLLEKKEENVKKMRETFPEVEMLLKREVGLNQPGTKVLFYRGREGIKQMVWNVLRTEKECIGYTFSALSTLTGKKFQEKWVKEYISRGLKFRDIFSDRHLEEQLKKKPNDCFCFDNFVSKYIPSKTIDFDHQIDIYNDVVAFYNWEGEEVFGVEIYNQRVARLQKQIFEVLWGIGEDLGDVLKRMKKKR